MAGSRSAQCSRMPATCPGPSRRNSSVPDTRCSKRCPGALAVLAAERTDPTGYGRIVRDTQGNVERIVEQKDADEAQRRIGLVNTGVIAADGNALKRWLSALRNDNAQGEYYLTDVF